MVEPKAQADMLLSESQLVLKTHSEHSEHEPQVSAIYTHLNDVNSNVCLYAVGCFLIRISVLCFRNLSIWYGFVLRMTYLDEKH